MIRKSSLYPVTLKLVRNDIKTVNEIFKKVCPHKGGFIGVCELKGCFAWENVGETFDSLELGETLIAVKNKNARSFQPLDVIRYDGTLLGYLPYAESFVPNLILKNGLKVYCYVEAKEFNGGMPAVAVSIYSEDY